MRVRIAAASREDASNPANPRGAHWSARPRLRHAHRQGRISRRFARSLPGGARSLLKIQTITYPRRGWSQSTRPCDSSRKRNESRMTAPLLIAKEVVRSLLIRDLVEVYQRKPGSPSPEVRLDPEAALARYCCAGRLVRANAGTARVSDPPGRSSSEAVGPTWRSQLIVAYSRQNPRRPSETARLGRSSNHSDPWCKDEQWFGSAPEWRQANAFGRPRARMRRADRRRRAMVRYAIGRGRAIGKRGFRRK